MVFANDGVFAGYQRYYLEPANGGNAAASLSAIYGSILRNIAQAFNRGIENCTALQPATGNCTNVMPKSSSNYNNGADKTASARWSIETNWYPGNGLQNYYAQYLHTATVTGQNVFNNIFWLPNSSLLTGAPPPAQGIASSNQSIKMGMVYGFAYDENPTYLITDGPNAIGPPYLAQVPTKLDPIPAGWSPISQLLVRVGP
jgi:hypothetical protein